MSAPHGTPQSRPNGQRKLSAPPTVQIIPEPASEGSTSSNSSSSTILQAKTRATRRYKAKFGASVKNGRSHENGHHTGSDQSQTSRCAVCNLVFYNSPPFASSSWLSIVYETIRLLHDEGIPHRKYFHYKHDICNFIDRNWTKLCPDKKRTLTWNNTVSAVITTHRKLFKSNTQQSGFWTLMPPPGTSVPYEEGDTDEENVDYVEKAREMKAQSRSATKMKKRKFGDISATPRAIPASRATSSPISFYKAYYTDGPATKMRTPTLADLHIPKPLDWVSPTPVIDPNTSDIPYVPISVRRRSRPPTSSYFTRVHARLQASTDPRAFSDLSSPHAASSSSSSPFASSLASSSHLPSHLQTNSQNHSHKTDTPRTNYLSTNGMHTSTPLRSSNAMDVTATTSTRSEPQNTSPNPTRPFTLSMAPPSPHPRGTSPSPSTKSRLSSSLIIAPPGVRQAKIIAASNLMAATAGLNSGSQSPLLLSRITGANGYTPRGEVAGPQRAHPQVSDPVIVPLPCGWFEKSFLHSSLRKRSSNQDIPLPVWKFLDEQEERRYWDSVKSEPDDEDISDERFIVQHKEYEKEEKKLKKLCS